MRYVDLNYLEENNMTLDDVRSQWPLRSLKTNDRSGYILGAHFSADNFIEYANEKGFDSIYAIISNPWDDYGTAATPLAAFTLAPCERRL